MTRRQALALSLTVASGALMSAGVAAAVALAGGDGGATFLVSTVAFVVPIVAFSVVGWLISSRRPANAIGWLLASIGLLFSVVVASSSIARWGLETGSLPRDLAEWIDVGSNVWVIALGLIGTQLLVRLPDGTLPSPRWRWFSRTTVALIAVALVGSATHVGPVEDVPGTANPLGATWGEPLEAAFGLVIGCFVVSIVALVLRYRRSTGHDRVQLRWVAFSGVVFVSIYLVGLSMLNVVGEDSTAGTVLISFVQMAFAALPIGIGFAVLRQRLYDIDVVINRALVYAALTATLAGTYLGSVLLLQLALKTVTQGSGLAVAASTLATAALVRPARSRIQATVDRRFFRRKYDSARTLAAFGMRLRDEVDLDALQVDLRTVVVETMQPEHVTLWLRTPEAHR